MRTFTHRMSILFILIRTLLCGMIQVEQQTEERMIIRFTQDALSYDLQTDENILGGIVEIDSLFENGYTLRTFSSIIENPVHVLGTKLNPIVFFLPTGIFIVK